MRRAALLAALLALAPGCALFVESWSRTASQLSAAMTDAGSSHSCRGDWVLVGPSWDRAWTWRGTGAPCHRAPGYYGNGVDTLEPHPLAPVVVEIQP